MRSRLFLRFALLIGVTLAAFAGRQSSTANFEVSSITFLSATHGWVTTTGSQAVIFRTTNGGDSWTRIVPPSEHGFYLIRFYDVDVGLGLAMEADDTTAVFRTTNGGTTWARVNTIRQSYQENIFDLLLTSPRDAFIIGEGSYGRGYVAQLSDEGRTVTVRDDLPVDFTQQSNALAVFGDRASHLWIAGKEFILHSADNGKTWENQYSNATPRIDMVMAGTALPGGHAWIAVANFEIYKTEDYGKKWTRVLSTAEESINFDSISFRDARNGCATSGSPFIYCTKDGGAHWTRWKAFAQYQSGSSFFSKLLLFGSKDGWATVGGALFKTSDGGVTFREVLTSSAPTASTIAGEFDALRSSVNGPTAVAYDDGFLYIVESVQGRLLRLDLKHDSIKVLIPENESQEYDFPAEIAADGRGNLFSADFNGRLRKLNLRSGEITVLLETSDKLSERILDTPSGMTTDADGNLLVTARRGVLRWNLKSSQAELIAGNRKGTFAGDGGPAIDAGLHFPMGLAVDEAGDIFIADYQNCRIRKIDHTTHVIRTIAGTGECASKGDGGKALDAALNYPDAVVVSTKGDVFFVEGATDRVRRIDTKGMITTYAGSGQKGYSGDGGPANKARLNNPSGLALDTEGNLYISEYVNNRIRRVDAVTRIISTIAGNGKPTRVEIEM